MKCLFYMTFLIPHSTVFGENGRKITFDNGADRIDLPRLGVRQWPGTGVQRWCCSLSVRLWFLSFNSFYVQQNSLTSQTYPVPDWLVLYGQSGPRSGVLRILVPRYRYLLTRSFPGRRFSVSGWVYFVGRVFAWANGKSRRRLLDFRQVLRSHLAVEKVLRVK